MIGWLWACAEPPEPSRPPEPVPVAAPEAVERVWSADNIRDLVPAAPTRTGIVSKAIPALPAYEETIRVLGAVVDSRAADPDNAWAIAHGVLARGAGFRLPDSRPAIGHLFATWAEPRSVGTLTLIGFPTTRNGAPVEPHTDLILKNIGEVGLLPSETFPAGGSSVTVADLYRYTLLRTFLIPGQNESSYQNPNDMPWGVQALAQWAPAEELRWTAANGTKMDMDDLTHFLVAVLHQESAFMFAAMGKGERFQRTGQTLFSYTCGGAHIVQGASYAVARGFGKPEDRKAVAAQAQLLLYRLPIELSIYDEATRQNPKHRLRLMVQRMKFLGHFLESISKMQALGLFTPDAAQLATIEGAAQNLTLTVSALDQYKAFDRLDEIRAAEEQLYLDIVGDSAHAVRGLELALGRGSIAY